MRLGPRSEVEAEIVNRPESTGAVRRTFWLVAFMWGAYFLNYCDRQAVFAMFPVLKQDLAMTDQQLGLTGALFLWVYGFGCPLAGQLADRFSKRWLVVLSLVIWSLVTVATGLATTAWMLLALRAAMGISESLYMPAAIALTANATAPRMRSRAVSLLTTAQIAGTVGGAWFGGWMAQRGQWREAFFLLGGLGMLYAIPYFMFLRRLNEDAGVETKRSGAKLSVIELIRVPTFRILCITFPVFVFGLWMLYSWLPHFLHEKFSLGLSQAAFTATAYMQTATLVGLFGGGVLADRLFLRTEASRLWLMMASLIMCAPCLYAIGNSDTLTVTRISLTAFGLFSGLLMGNVFPAAFEVVPADTRASAVGLLNFFGAVLSGFAPLIVGTWKLTIGIERMLSYTACAYIVAAALLAYAIHSLFRFDYERVH